MRLAVSKTEERKPKARKMCQGRYAPSILIDSSSSPQGKLHLILGQSHAGPNVSVTDSYTPAVSMIFKRERERKE